MGDYRNPNLCEFPECHMPADNGPMCATHKNVRVLGFSWAHRKHGHGEAS